MLLLPPMLPRTNATPEFLMFTLLTLLFALGTETAPTKSLLFDKVIGLAEAANELISKLDVPGMVNTVEPVP